MKQTTNPTLRNNHRNDSSLYLLKFDLCRFRLVRRIGFDIRNCCDLFRCRFATEKDFVCISSLRSEYRIEVVVVVVVVVGAVSLDSFDGRILVSSLLLLL